MIVVVSKNITRYLVACDTFSDKECLDCNVLPVCGGGCVYNRIENHFYKKEHIICSPYKNFMKEHLVICKELLINTR